MFSSFKKKKVLFCILMLLLTVYIFIPSKFDITDNNILINKDKENPFLINSVFYNLTGSSIFIDDLDPEYNWSKTAAENDWCSGTGTWNDPYIIENVIIDAKNPFNIETVIIDLENSTSCITIQNSNVNFIIRNCTICNSGARFLDSGIKLINVNNSRLINNNCSSNTYGMILILDYNNSISNYNSNNTISYNILQNNYAGVASYSNNNTISNNIITSNLIGLVESGMNDIISLNLLDNNYAGIFLFDGYKNKISKNNLTHNIEGLRLLYSNNNSIIENSINNNEENGIFLQTSHYNNISKNECNSNRNNGIHLQGGFYPYMGPYQYCDYNWISENNLYNNSCGILLNYTKFNHIINNIINYNEFSGIELNNSDNIDILNNKIDGNYYGINMKESNWNDIIQNTINNNYYGISLTSSHFNSIIGNVLHYNRICYIENDYCSGNRYEDNECIEIKINEINWVLIFIIISLIGLVVLLFVLLGRKRTTID